MNAVSLIKQGRTLEILYQHAEKGEYLDKSKNGFTKLHFIEKLFRTVMSFFCYRVESYTSASLTYSLTNLKDTYNTLKKIESDLVFEFTNTEETELKVYPNITLSHLLLIFEIKRRCLKILTSKQSETRVRAHSL